jgi:hypothetical protein
MPMKLQSSVFWDIALCCPPKDPQKTELFTIAVVRIEILHYNAILIREICDCELDWTLY